jgi:hypothetical protein
MTRDQLQEQDQAVFAEYSEKMADQIERVSSYLEEHDLDELKHSAEDFARRQPELFLGGAFTLGLLAGRFLKSSAQSGPRQTYLAHSTNPVRSYRQVPETTMHIHTPAG